MVDAYGNYVAAELLYIRAEAGMEHALPPENPVRSEQEYFHSPMRQKQERLTEALPLAELAAAGAAKSLPANSPDRLQYEKNRSMLAGASPSPQPATVTTTR